MSDPITATEALRRIHALLDGTEWDADAIDAIADVLRAAGFTVRDIMTKEEDSRG